VELLPYVPIATTLRTGIAVFSYCDTVTFGITGDYGSMPDLEVLARGIEDGITALRKAGPAPRRPGRPGAARGTPAPAPT
jgi:diacylglycerol O-acyltransferase